MDGAVVLDFWILNPECQFSKFDLIYLENYFSIFVDFEVVMTFGLLIWKPLELFHQSFQSHPSAPREKKPFHCTFIDWILVVDGFFGLGIQSIRDIQYELCSVKNGDRLFTLCAFVKCFVHNFIGCKQNKHAGSKMKSVKDMKSRRSVGTFILLTPGRCQL